MDLQKLTKEAGSESGESERDQSSEQFNKMVDQIVQKNDFSAGSIKIGPISESINSSNDKFHIPGLNFDNNYQNYESEPTKTTFGADSAPHTKNDGDAGSNAGDCEEKIPKTLKDIIYHSRTSMTYKALNQEPIPGLTQHMHSSIVADLRKYIDNAVDRGLIKEAHYVQTVIDGLKVDKNTLLVNSNREISVVEQKIKDTHVEIEERNEFWKSQRLLVDKELDMALQELEIQGQQCCKLLDEEWQSQKKIQQYSKPSPALLNLRDIAKKMIKSKKFEELEKISQMISNMEQKEADAASKRMNEDYRAADLHIQERFKHEKEVLYSNHEKKANNLIRNKERNMRPIIQRLENLEKQKELIIKGQSKCLAFTAQKTPAKKDAPKQMTKSPRRNQNNLTMASILKNPKLSIAGITPLKRNMKTSNQNNIVMVRSSKSRNSVISGQPV